MRDMYEGGRMHFPPEGYGGYDPMMEDIMDRERRLYDTEDGIDPDRPLPKLINWSAIWHFFFPKKEGTPQ